MTPSVYAVGDLQGCLESLTNLLEIVPKNAQLLFVGDLVNRGPESLATLRYVKDLCDAGRARTLLGNHDLHLLAVAAGAGSVHRKDTIGEILTAPDYDDLINWLRRQPLLIDTPDTVFVHAGIPPRWTLEQAKTLAHEAETHLQADDWKDYLQGMYGAENFRDDLTGPARMRAIFNGLTRMRFIGPDSEPEYNLKEGADKGPHWGSFCAPTSWRSTPGVSGAGNSPPCAFPTGGSFRKSVRSGPPPAAEKNAFFEINGQLLPVTIDRLTLLTGGVPKGSAAFAL